MISGAPIDFIGDPGPRILRQTRPAKGRHPLPNSLTPHLAPRTLAEAILALPVLRALPDAARPLLLRLLELLILLLIFLLVRFVLRRLLKRTINAVARREEETGNEGRAARVRTLGSILRSVLSYTLGFIFFVAALGTMGVDVRGVLGTAGVAGLAVGFGAQKLVRDVISGFFLLLEDQYAVGDYVTIGSVTGVVEELGMRITRLRDDDGRLYILANGDISQVCNMSRGPLAGSLEVAIAASADAGKASEVLDAAFARISEEMALAEPARVEGISAADAAKTVLRVRFRAGSDQRPAADTLRLREAARQALNAAEIPLA